ncbi:MAG: trypsin-like serine protease, partial [Deltaproteobacteria bacterium]|nr:trypsin-like serine protease [Deltaproteobacteria bacterium]
MRRFAMFVGVFLGCGAPVGTSSRGITGGSEAQSDAEVFMVSFRVFGVPNMCSATLIGERTLLTAAHCVDASLYPLSPTLRFEASNLTVARRASPTDLIEVIEVRMHPGWGLGHLENDLALMLLATAPEGVAPKPVNTEDLAPLTGQPLRALGYGYADPDEYDSWGTKRVTELRLERVEPGFLFGG